ncbi:hypothetical protein EW145_g4090 [Phellinidium pouzarii]|uniref:Uncharacterized protein n=1 Tax=Phellinidium pouzarii TaxID=167371 RepID=A0A4S4L595_9AGAM|nr:hypothetical protein EW145_g4090 [Phellinidium pouzarii]
MAEDNAEEYSPTDVCTAKETDGFVARRDMNGTYAKYSPGGDPDDNTTLKKYGGRERDEGLPTNMIVSVDCYASVNDIDVNLQSDSSINNQDNQQDEDLSNDNLDENGGDNSDGNRSDDEPGDGNRQSDKASDDGTADENADGQGEANDQENFDTQ